MSAPRTPRKRVKLLVTTYELVRNGKVIFSSTRKLDAVFKHVKYTRAQKVFLRENVKEVLA
jgi:hypothetical protein